MPERKKIDYSMALSSLPSLDEAYGQYFTDALMLLCITDTRFLKMARNVFPAEFATGRTQQAMLRVWYDYWDKFSTAPGDDYEMELNSALNSRKLTEQEYAQAIEYCTRLAETVDVSNPEAILDKLGEFALQRRWLAAGIAFVHKVRSADLEGGRSLIYEYLREGTSTVLDSGVDIFSEESISNRAMRRAFSKPNLMRLMIGPFDKAGIGLNRGWLVLGAAPEKYGKTWMGIHVAKVALLQGLRVLFCSHGDLSTDEMEDRFDQCFSGSFHWRKKPQRRYETKWFDSDGELRISTVKVNSIEDIKVIKHGVSVMSGFGGKLRVKWWPMNACTIGMMDAYLDHLAVNEGFYPDVIINDYAEIMKLSSQERSGVNLIYEDHKRMAGERKAVVMTFSQVNKKAYTKKWITMGDFAEDKRKAAHCDLAFALCITPEEERQKLARMVMFVDRHFGLRGYCAEMIQDYAIGQFCKSARKVKRIEEEKKDDSEATES